jgi:hypothetical protein
MQTGARELMQAQTKLQQLLQPSGGTPLCANVKADLEATCAAAKRNQLTCTLAARGSFATKKMSLDFSAHPFLPVVKFM